MADTSLPWIIGPIPWICISLATLNLLYSLFTRKGLTACSVFSCLGLTSFVAASAVSFLQLPFTPILLLVLAQAGGMLIYAILFTLLRLVQKPKKALNIPDWTEFRKGILKVIFSLVLWNALAVLTWSYKCGDATVPGYGKCRFGEEILGVHGPFLNTFLAVTFGVPSLYMLIFAAVGPLLKSSNNAHNENRTAPPE